MNELCQCFLKMQEIGYMRDVDPRRVFLNYPELYLHNSKFWKKAVLPMLQASRFSSVDNIFSSFFSFVFILLI